MLAAYGAAVALWSLGQWAREATWITGLCFFVPSPALGVLGLCLSLWGWWRGSRWPAALLAALALVPLAWTAVIENHDGAGARASRAPARQAQQATRIVRLVHWNACRGCRGAEEIARTIERWPADIYVISESPAAIDWARRAAAWSPGWQAVYREDAAVLARGDLRPGQTRGKDESWTFRVDWREGGVRLRLLVVDLTPRLSVARRPLLEWVRAQIGLDRPDVVVGDFNTPRRARGLSPLAPGFVHAYDAAGSGWSYTFPAGAALLAIDQCFVGPGLSVRSHRLVTTPVSDHRMQVIELEVPTSP